MLSFKINQCAAAMFLILTVVIMLPVSSACEQEDFSRIEKYVEQTPHDAEKSVASLAAYLVKPAKNDTEKVRAIYCWMVSNINYDIAAYKSGKIGNQSSTTVLKTRTAVCEGYAELFKAIATAAGVETEVITGFSRGKGYKTGDKFDKKDHAWNAVKIDGKWRLLDCVWGAGYLDDGDKFVRSRCDHYFLTQPDQFVFDHLPEDPKWQLLDKPLSKAEYEKLVYTRPSFFRHSLKVISHTLGIIKTGRQCSVTLESPKDVVLTADVHKGETKVDDALVFLQRDGDRIELDTLFPDLGEYMLRIYAKRKSDEGPYECAIEYAVQVDSSESSLQGFPMALSTFQQKDAYLYTPLCSSLKPGTTETFKISVPGAMNVAVIINGKFIQLAKNGDVFEGQAAISGSDVKIAARFPENDSYMVLLKYSVL